MDAATLVSGSGPGLRPRSSSVVLPSAFSPALSPAGAQGHRCSAGFLLRMWRVCEDFKATYCCKNLHVVALFTRIYQSAETGSGPDRSTRPA